VQERNKKLREIGEPRLRGGNHDELKTYARPGGANRRKKRGGGNSSGEAKSPNLRGESEQLEEVGWSPNFTTYSYPLKRNWGGSQEEEGARRRRGLNRSPFKKSVLQNLIFDERWDKKYRRPHFCSQRLLFILSGGRELNEGLEDRESRRPPPFDDRVVEGSRGREKKSQRRANNKTRGKDRDDYK